MDSHPPPPKLDFDKHLIKYKCWSDGLNAFRLVYSVSVAETEIQGTGWGRRWGMMAEERQRKRREEAWAASPAGASGSPSTFSGAALRGLSYPGWLQHPFVLLAPVSIQIKKKKRKQTGNLLWVASKGFVNQSITLLIHCLRRPSVSITAALTEES